MTSRGDRAFRGRHDGHRRGASTAAAAAGLELGYGFVVDVVGRGVHIDHRKLTVKSLAEEARVKRWLLTHRHTDLQEEFRARIANTSVEPPAIRALQDEKAEALKKVTALTAEVTALSATVRQLERIINVLALENRQLRGDSERSRVVAPLQRVEH